MNTKSKVYVTSNYMWGETRLRVVKVHRDLRGREIAYSINLIGGIRGYFSKNEVIDANSARGRARALELKALESLKNKYYAKRDRLFKKSKND